MGPKNAGLENYGQTCSKLRMKLQGLENDGPLSFSNWWRTSSASSLTGVLSVQIASVFVIGLIGRVRTIIVIIIIFIVRSGQS